MTCFCKVRSLLSCSKAALALYAALLIFASIAPCPCAADAPPVTMHWLDGGVPDVAQGVSWGVPWPRGTVARNATFHVTNARGDEVPSQSWPMAYWPDGTLKWTGNAIAVPAGAKDDSKLTVTPLGSLRAPVYPLDRLHVSENDVALTVSTGSMTCKIPKSGEYLISSISRDNRLVAQQGRLVCQREDQSELEMKGVLREEYFTSRIDSVTVEQPGDVRTVIKIEGRHQAANGGRLWLPFIVRLYFYAGVDTIRMVHTLLYDGDQYHDFIRGIGLRFSVPMREQAHNRHVRFAGESGMFAEPVRLIAGRRNPSPDLYAKQIGGKPTGDLPQLPEPGLVSQMAAWDGFKLTQPSAGAYTIRKRTGPQSSWIDASSGTHALGLGFVGDTTGGLAIAMKDFWQLAPTEFEVENAYSDTAELTLWLWSPDVPAMDLRHYDTAPHGLQSSYEDVEPDVSTSTATGIGRTTEILIQPYSQVPDNKDLLALAKSSAAPPHPVCSPDYLHSINTFGPWSLVDRSSKQKRELEDGLDKLYGFYATEIDERGWYGFWDYGDVMHTYDPTRHSWKYDVGGFAWDNTELMPDLWLWYSFLRTGRADMFRTAEAMTRQSQEVDVYHLGPMAGLGSRHNVRHWGDGAKEDRIGQAIQKRFYYYLTTDERTGDLMHEATDVDYKLVTLDPLRKLLPKGPRPTHVRSGPDWLALAGNWMTEWERTGNTKYRAKILTGMLSLAEMPKGLLTSLSFGYDPATGVLFDLPDHRITPDRFTMIFGGFETACELQTLIELPDWNKTWLDLCLTWARDGGADMAQPRTTAYAAWATSDPSLAKLALTELTNGSVVGQPTGNGKAISGPDVPKTFHEIPGVVSTNGTAQSSLNVIETMELLGRVSAKGGRGGG